MQSRLWCESVVFWSKLTKSLTTNPTIRCFLWTGSRRQAFEEDGGSAALSWGCGEISSYRREEFFSMSGKNRHSEWSFYHEISSYHEISYPCEWVEEIWNISQVMTDRNFIIAIASPSSIVGKPTSYIPTSPPQPNVKAKIVQGMWAKSRMSEFVAAKWCQVVCFARRDWRFLLFLFFWDARVVPTRNLT